MASVVADTHSIVWYLYGEARLSAAALFEMDPALSGGDPMTRDSKVQSANIRTIL